MKIAIMGAGSLGTIIGAYLSKRNELVELIDVNQAHVDVLNQSGATITGTINETIAVKAITPDKMEGHYDLVLLLTKQMYNTEVLENLEPHLDEDSIVLSLQNGVPEDSLATVLGRKRIVGGSVEFGATWVEPGVSELTTAAEAFQANAFQIGELDGTTTERIQQIKGILDGVGNTTISANLIGTKWAKLLVNVAMSGMSAVLGCAYGDVLKNEIAVMSAVMLADETIKVGTASGVEFDELAGFNLNIFNIATDKANLPQAIGFTKKAFAPQALLKASMLQDLEKKQKTEIDYINGFVSAKGKEVNISTPFNDLLVRLVKKAEEEKTLPDFEENLAYFEALLS
ncbi:ketopantoate reductase family protein [Oceanobacillus alkalisoli]|uniref:ketopantoate reductase family protein n=1 Tax=Oceanobacillus alkalisoli TaxID=2925113 RepID=UPI001F11DAEF|nr:ketopantoate reductase family protein [Oceanobacillus alkalisoli]MCF3943141.1 ketopantoate reductase family protein [Oceanobacillus alkalisoli]